MSAYSDPVTPALGGSARSRSCATCGTPDEAAAQNGEGSGQNAGAAQIFFDSSNASVLRGASSNNFTVAQDADGTGYAGGSGESSVRLDLRALDSAFEIALGGDTANSSDTAGDSPRIYRANDSAGNGTIEEIEVSVFTYDSNSFGEPLDFAFDAFMGDLVSLELFGASLLRLIDFDGSGDINDLSEAPEVWIARLVRDPFLSPVFFGLAAGPAGDLVLTSSGGDAKKDLLIYLRDLNSDGLFTDPDETIVALSGDTNGVFPDRASTAAFYSPVVAPVPLPAALRPMLAGLGLLGALRRRG